MLIEPTVLETDEAIFGFAAGTRVRLVIDNSLPHLVTDQALDDLKPVLEQYVE
jgi:hypothetical protein